MSVIRTIRVACLSAALLTLTACVFFPKSPDLGKVTDVAYTIDAAATIIPADYGKSYLLEGNIVARYQDFDLVRIHAKTIATGHLEKAAGVYSTFQIRDRSGKPLKQLLLSPPHNSNLLHFTVNHRSYHISHGMQQGSVIINIPSHHFAYHHVTIH